MSRREPVFSFSVPCSPFSVLRSSLVFCVSLWFRARRAAWRTRPAATVSSRGGPAAARSWRVRRPGRGLSIGEGHAYGSLSLVGSRRDPRRGGRVLGEDQGRLLALLQHRVASGLDPG